jgi:nucleoside triphosphate diphosphatase
MTTSPMADEPNGSGIERLLRVMARLRDPERGCPWDLEQNFRTIAPHTIEEAYEVADAIERGDMAEIREEVGDLLFQVVFYARMAEEAGEFDFDAVAGGLADKMIRRHPHVFGAERVATSAAMNERWEQHKAEERRAKGPASILDGVVIGLPALTRAVKLQKRAARVGFDWTRPREILDKIEEEARELRAEIDAGAGRERLEDELGDLLFAVANLGRRLEIDPEGAIRRTNLKFERRFRRIEQLLAAEGRSAAEATLDEMEALWQQAKREEANPPPPG